jgi:hypothetical protein
LAGLDDRLTINLATGTAQLQRHKEVMTATLSAEQRSRLVALIAALDVASLAATPPHRCCDFLSYRIQIDATTIQTTDADLPASLQPLVTELNAIITGIAMW